jgi:hypothetical protein
MRRFLFILVSIFFWVTSGQVLAQQDFVVYPSQGQSQQKMEKDKYECNSWAKQQTGFDPKETPRATSAPPPGAQTSAGRGAVRGGAVGALGGLAIGSLSGNAGKGAAIGAVSGGLIGGLRGKSQQDQAQQAQQQWADQQAYQYRQRRDEYNRACKACLIGRGYTVQ